MAHHYNPARVMIIPPSPSSYPHYELVFANTESGEQVRMQIPRHGMFEDPTQEITPAQVEDLAEQIGNVINNFTGESSGFAAEARTKKRRSQKG